MTSSTLRFCVQAALLFPLAAPAFSAEEPTAMSWVVVNAPAVKANEVGPEKRLATGDTASLLVDIPGVSLNTSGGISSLPAIHGLADDRLRIVVDGMEVTSACANHMNPPLSYVSPSQAARIRVWAGISPVSEGGDNVGGTISIESADLPFSSDPQKLLTGGTYAIDGRSNGRGAGASFMQTMATSSISVGITAAYDSADDYRNGMGDKVTSTYYEARSIGLQFAAKHEAGLTTLRLGTQSIPRQGFVNQQMDMVSNRANFANLAFAGKLGTAELSAKLYWQDARHEMNLGEDKPGLGAMMFMPMNTHGIDLGYSVKATWADASGGALRIGTDLHRFRLDDWWPPVAGAEPYMGPDTFQNIAGGRRDRAGAYAESERKWRYGWTTLVGVRFDHTGSAAGSVHGYSDMYASDAGAFNARSHGRIDNQWDATLLVRKVAAAGTALEVGYARKSRAPSLYERYAWATDWMSSGMINWYGDGNYYVGNPDLSPEVAHTVSAGLDWPIGQHRRWGAKVMGYYTYLQNGIGVDVIDSATWGATFNKLRFANHDARLYGVDFTGRAQLWDSPHFGIGQAKAVAGLVRGKVIGTDSDLYHLMPLNVKLSLQQWLGGWANTLEFHFVNRKTAVDPLRLEPATAGYVLLNASVAYQWQKVRVDAGVKNVLNKYYALPLGGVDFDRYYRTMWAGSIGPVTGQGRSFNIGLTANF